MSGKLFFLLLIMAMPISIYGASDAPLPKMLEFPASQGVVVFNHKKHADTNSNCKTCHDRRGGKIKGLGKTWAHKVCKGCHEAIMIGPVKCDGCHRSEEK